MSERYIYSEEQCNELLHTDLVSFVQSHGMTCKKVGNDEVHVLGYGGLYIKQSDNTWYCHSEGKGGRGVASFAKHYFNMEWLDVMRECFGSPSQPAGELKGKKQNQNKPYVVNRHYESQLDEGNLERKKLIMPEKEDNTKRVFAYLSTERGLSGKLINDFIKKDTGIEIVFGRKSIGETIAKAIQDDKRHRSVEARVAALYQMQEIIENAICFDSEISDYDPITSKNKSPNTLFMHKMYGVMNYKGEPYLADLTIEEMYSRSLAAHNLETTSNKVYSFKGIKITPMKPGLNPRDQMQNGIGSVSLGATISIAQLYDFVKSHDRSFFENPSAPGRAERVEEINNEIAFDDAKAKLDIVEEARTVAHKAGLPFSKKPWDGEDFNPYVFDGRMSIEDYELMRRMMDIGREEQAEPEPKEAEPTTAEEEKKVGLLSFEQFGETRFRVVDETENDILKLAATGEKPFVALMNIGESVSEPKFAEIMQSTQAKFSVDINLDNDEVNIFEINEGKGGIAEGDRNDNNTVSKTAKLSSFADPHKTIKENTADNSTVIENDHSRNSSFNPAQKNSQSDKMEKSFAEQIDAVLSGNGSRYNDLKVCDTPQILLDAGCEQLPMLYTQRHLKEAIKPKNAHTHAHGLSVEQIKKIPELLEKPVMVYDSISRNDSIVVLTSEADSDNLPIVVSIKPNGEGKYELEQINSNFITSIYGRENFLKHLEQVVDKGNVLYYDKQKSQELFRVLGLQSSQGVNNLDSNVIIHKSNNIVNTYSEKYQKNLQQEIKQADSLSDNKTTEEIFAENRISADNLKINTESNEYKQRNQGNSQSEESDISFTEQVEKSISGDLPFYSALKVCDTPDILLQAGLAQLPMLYTQKHLKDALSTKEAGNIHRHGLNIEQIKKIPQLLEEPVMIYDSLSKKDSIIAVTSEFDGDNLPIVVSIKPNGSGRYNLETVESNFITSIHGRNNFINQIEKAVENDKMIFFDKNKSQSMFERWGLQLPELTNNLDSNIIIHKSNNIVNTFHEENKKMINDYKIPVPDKIDTAFLPKEKYKNNMAAIRTLKKIESENREAAPEEQDILAKYVGWGGLSEVFDDNKQNWADEYTELRELLTESEYETARASTNTAFYTPPIVINAMYKALENIGFKGGNILDTSMGIGNFFGVMPEEIKNNSSLIGVEIDDISGRIAKLLYPSAEIIIKGFEKTNFENNRFDVAISNIPFGDLTIRDKEHGSMLIHDYFFEKALDKVRPGGIVAFVTSMGTMDRKSTDERKSLANRAEFLGAIRLPNNTFSSANTSITSDIIFLQKREHPILSKDGWVYRDFIDSADDKNQIIVNSYFAENPNMIIGEMTTKSGRFGSEDICALPSHIDFKEKLNEAVLNIKGVYSARNEITMSKLYVSSSEGIPCPEGTKLFTYVVYNDEVHFVNEDGLMVVDKDLSSNDALRVAAMCELRDYGYSLLEKQLDKEVTEEEISIIREELNKKYDSFVKKFGYINNKSNRSAFNADIGKNFIFNFEKVDSNGNVTGKNDILTKRVVGAAVEITHTDSSEDALVISLNEKMCVDLEYMSKLTGKSQEELLSELENVLFQNPDNDMKWETSEEYLTGDVRQKLLVAQAMGLEKNIAALTAVQPEWIGAENIAVNLGSPLINTSDVIDFIKEKFGCPYGVNVEYCETTNEWNVSYSGYIYNPTQITEIYGTKDKNAIELLDACLNSRDVQVREPLKDEFNAYVRDKKGKIVSVVNTEKTKECSERMEKIQNDFEKWVYSDSKRRKRIERDYNYKFNSIRNRTYDGSHMRFVGINPNITLAAHQKDAIYRALCSGNTLLAHEAGAGKTYEMIAIAMEGKRLGQHSKAMFVVPKSLTEQTGRAFLELYPQANILVATEKDFSPANRRKLMAKIATGDFDAVILGHSQFDMLTMSKERELENIRSQIDDYRQYLAVQRSINPRGFSVKRIERAINKLKTNLEKINDRKADESIDFELLGIDKLFIDESQYYKNMSIITNMTNVKGLGSGSSAKSIALYEKLNYLNDKYDNKAVVFASGTPVSNSLTELYTLHRYLQPDLLKRWNCSHFDQWANLYATKKESFEMSVEGSGTWRKTTRLSFKNLPELVAGFKECADIRTQDSLNLPRPNAIETTIVAEPSSYQEKIMKEIGLRAERIHNGTVNPCEDNMLKITTDGRKVGLDARVFDPNLPDHPSSKVNLLVENVFKIYNETNNKGSTQLIFCDTATPHEEENMDRYVLYRNSAEGYNPVYAHALGNKETIDKIIVKLNSDKSPKDFESGGVFDGDIIVIKKVNKEEEVSSNVGYIMRNGKMEQCDNLFEKTGVKETEVMRIEKRFCVYDDIKEKLINKGIPENEIAFIHDAGNDVKKRQAIFDKLNNGEIRIMIGSTGKCGVGMNAQKKMIALHHLDAPYRPSDMEQRNCRLHRQGNENEEVQIYKYVTKNTFDAYIYQLLASKQKTFGMIMSESAPIRLMNDIDEIQLSYAETAACCSGNPLIGEKLKLEGELTDLRHAEKTYKSQLFSLHNKLNTLPLELERREKTLERHKSDAEIVKSSVQLLFEKEHKSLGYYKNNILGKSYIDNQELGDCIKKLALSCEVGKSKDIGKYRGFDISVNRSIPNFSEYPCITVKGAFSYIMPDTMEYKNNSTIIKHLDNFIESIPNSIEDDIHMINSVKQEIIDVENAIKIPFSHEMELKEKAARYDEICSKLENDGSFAEVEETSDNVCSKQHNLNGDIIPRQKIKAR